MCSHLVCHVQSTTQKCIEKRGGVCVRAQKNVGPPVDDEARLQELVLHGIMITIMIT